MKYLFPFIFVGFFSTQLVAQNITEQAKNNNIFAFKLFKNLQSDKENVFISPYSISSALAMTYLGAKNNTKTIMQNTLHFYKKSSKSFNLLNKTFDKYNDSLLSLKIANALWIDKNIKIKFCFKKKNKKYFKSQLYSLKTVAEINKWASTNTNDKIKKIVDKKDITNSKLILTNAVYFNAEWKYPFITKLTRKEKFTTSNSSVVDVNMMKHKEKYNYTENDNYQAIEIPYKGNNISMIVILPKKSIKELDFSADKYSDLIKNLKTEEIKLFIPKFEFESSYKLKDVLSTIGMKEAFTSVADFTGISNEKLFISQVLHKTFIGVNEKGTEAAAVTAVLMRTTSTMPKPIKTFKANKPFMFIIKDVKTNSIIFMGSIENPNL